MASNARAPLADTNSQTVKRLLDVIHRFRLKRQTMPAHLIEALLLVSLNPGKSVKYYAEQSGVSTSVMSRHLLDLSTAKFRNGTKGLGLIEKKVSAHSLREHEVSLTPEGLKTVSEIAKLLSGKDG